MHPHEEHARRVTEAALSQSAAARSRLAASWRRSLVRHGVDPVVASDRQRLDAIELHHRREAAGLLLSVAAPRLDRLFALVGGGGGGVLLCNADGIVLDHRIGAADATDFVGWGLWSGANWSEAHEGTNGIGTCLAEERAVIIHRDEHFHIRNVALSCIDAPIYGPDGRLIAALDVSAAQAGQTEQLNRLIFASVAQTAHQVECALFRSRFANCRIVVVDCTGADGAALLAIDRDDLVVGATRSARRLLDLGTDPVLEARPARDLLEGNDAPEGLDAAERATLVRALARSGGNASRAARELGIGRATLYRRMKRVGLSGDLSRK